MKPVKHGEAGDLLRLREDRVRTAPLHCAAFVDGDGAEVAFAVTAAVSGDGEADRFQRLDLALFGVVGVLVALIIEAVNVVQCFLAQVRVGRVLNQVAVAVQLGQTLRADGVVVVIEGMEHGGEGVFVLLNDFKGGQFEIAFGHFFGVVTQAPDGCRILSLVKGAGQVDDSAFGHAVEQVIGFGVKEDGPADLVRPEVIMGGPAQGGFHAAQHDRDGVFEVAADQVRIDQRGAVGAFGVFPAGGVIILAAGTSGGGIVGDHRVDRAGADAPEQTRLTQAGDVRFGLNIRLCDDPDLVTRVEQDFADHRHAHERGINVGVAGDENDVELLPAELVQFFMGCG